MFRKKSALFAYLSILTLFFILFEISFFIQSHQIYLADFKEVSDRLALPDAIFLDIFYFLGIQISLHFGFAILIMAITALIARVFLLSQDRFIQLGLGLWLFGIVTLLLANQVYFPYSKFSALMSSIFPPYIAHYLFIASLIISILVLCMAALGLIKWGVHSFFSRIITAIFMGGGLLTYAFSFSEVKPLWVNTSSHPNVIIVGVDALRPDFLNYFGRNSHTPFFNDFLGQATVFSNAFTPLARTFPSWVGILTGDYPKKTGARSNLVKQDRLDFHNSLAAILKKQGYETVYASDETRFSNIDGRLGFNHLITPTVGLNDFLLGTFNDFPFSNLIVNTALGSVLFPYSYGNRPAYVTYQPNRFLKLVQKGLLKINAHKPLFLAIHFCLPHLPYLWADAKESTNMVDQYQASVERADQQLKDFFSLLKQQGLLTHAIVVLLSDHGEALALSGDRITEKNHYVGNLKKMPRFYPPSFYNEAVNQSAGHGTDVLGLSQYHTLLSFRLYGVAAQQKIKFSGLVSLLAIQPTILALLHLPSEHAESVANFIRHATSPSLGFLFLESDYSPASIRTVYPEMEKVALEGADLFQVDAKTMRLTLKENRAKQIIKSKQFAIIEGEWMLALYPRNAFEPYFFILINLQTGLWTNDLNSSFARHSPFKKLLEHLKQFYKEDLTLSAMSTK